MAVNLSPVGGVAAQFFDNSGNPLSGGKLYSYLAGTTTPATTYTSSNGSTAHSNPIVLDAAGRVPAGGEIWLTDGINYKFVLKTSTDTLIATYDNITGINSNAVAYTNQQEIQTATAGQTVFTLAISYQPGTNSLSVFVDGVNQYGPGAQYSYVETNANTVTFNSGLHAGASVKFTTTQQQGAGAVSADQISYTPAGIGAVATNVQAELRLYANVIDFGATGDGVTDDTAAIQAAVTAICKNTDPAAYGSNTPRLGPTELFIPAGLYKITDAIVATRSISIKGEGHSEFSEGTRIIQYTSNKDHFTVVPIAQGSSVSFTDLTLAANGGGGTGGACINITKAAGSCNSIRIIGCTFGTPQSYAIRIQAGDDVMIHDNLFDVSATNCILLGTPTASNVVSNCSISRNTWYSIGILGLAVCNVDGLIVSNNRVYPSGANMLTFMDGYNTLPYQLKNIVVSDNTFKGINCLMNLQNVSGLTVCGNNAVSLGAGTGATLSGIQLIGTCSNVNITGNNFTGTFDTQSFYSDAGATVNSSSITGNVFNNTGGVGLALNCYNTIGNVDSNSFYGFVSPSVSEHFYTTGNAIAPGVISAGSSYIFNKTVTGTRQGDQVQLSSPSTVWPVSPVGIVVTSYASNANQISIRYDNVTSSPIGVPPHDFGIEVSR